MHPFLDLLDKNASDRGTRLAACDATLMLDYAALRAVSFGLAEQIRAKTQRKHVGILAPTSAAAAAAIAAVWQAGKIAVPLNFLLAPAELAVVIRDSAVDLVITTEMFAAQLESLNLGTLVLSGKKTLVPGQGSTPSANLSDTAAILYTSGTDGAPKGVCLSFENLIENMRACVEHEQLSPDHVFVSPLPQFHSFGFTAMTVVPLALGATVWYLPRFSPVAVVEHISSRQATVFMATPSMFGALAHLRDAESEALSSLQLAISGGEPLPATVERGFADRFRVPIIEGYGLTETSPVVSINTPWSRRSGSVGRPIPGVSVFATGADGAALPAGEEGELAIRGHCVMQGYLNRPDATAQAIRDGTFFTGDIGHVDADGFIWITGRAKDMIIVGGENVAPREIEAVLCTHPAVADAAAIAAPDGMRGEVPVAFVILREGATAEASEIRQHCRGKLAAYKTPREVIISSDLPRSPTGKILKRELRKRVKA